MQRLLHPKHVNCAIRFALGTFVLVLKTMEEVSGQKTLDGWALIIVAATRAAKFVTRAADTGGHPAQNLWPRFHEEIYRADMHLHTLLKRSRCKSLHDYLRKRCIAEQVRYT